MEKDILYIHLFSHTHWDFEWYEVQEGYKLQLVRLIEHLLGPSGQQKQGKRCGTTNK